MNKLLGFVIVAAFALTLVPAAASACTCPHRTFEAARVEATHIFEAKALSHDQKKGWSWTMEATRSWKGKLATRVLKAVAENPSMCSPHFANGHTYLVYAYEKEGVLYVKNCDRSTTVTQKMAKEDIQKLGKATPAPKK
jgi:hypothetical protein